MADPSSPKVGAAPKKVGVPVAAGGVKKFGGPQGPTGPMGAPKKVGGAPNLAGTSGSPPPQLSTSPTTSMNSHGKLAPVVPPRGATPGMASPMKKMPAKPVGAVQPNGTGGPGNQSPARGRALPTPGETPSSSTTTTTTQQTPEISVSEETPPSMTPTQNSAPSSAASTSDSVVGGQSEPYVPKSFRSTVNVDNIAALRKGASNVHLNGGVTGANGGSSSSLGGGGTGNGQGGAQGGEGVQGGGGGSEADDFAKPANATRRIEEALQGPLFAKVEANIKTKRDNAAYEVLTSEQSYCRSLTILNELFRLTLMEATKRNTLPGITEELVSNIFSRYFVDISRVNFVLLGGLVERLGEWDETQMLGDLLIEMLPFLKMYTLYSGNYERAMLALAELEALAAKENNPVALFMAEVMSNPMRTVDFRSYLIMPIQRIPRYRMLVEELIKGTSAEHPDYAALQKALESIKEVAIQCDAAIEQHKNRTKMLEIQDSFFGEKVHIIEAGRVFLREGDMDKVCRKDVQKRKAWLFNNLFLYAKQLPSSSRYSKHRAFPLSNIRVKDLPDDGKIYKNAIQIASEKKSFVLLASSPDDKASWLTEFAKALAEQEKTIRGQDSSANIVVAPVWVPDSEALRCMICGEKFTIMQRRHHCRQCGSVVCSKCSAKKKELPGQGKKRVCDSCYTKPYPDSSSLSSASSSSPGTATATPTPDSSTPRSASSAPPVSLGPITVHSSPSPNANGPPSPTSNGASPSPAGATPNKVSELYRAAYDYEPPVETPKKKLGFKAGDVMEITIKNDPGWWLAILGDQKGWVPASFLEPFSP